MELEILEIRSESSHKQGRLYHSDCGFWVSKLQLEIALSEFIALSSLCFRSLILTKKHSIEETFKELNITRKVKWSAKSTAFEDNNGALQLATTKKLTPPTRHIATKYFCFWNKWIKDLWQLSRWSHLRTRVIFSWKIWRLKIYQCKEVIVYCSW